MSATRLNGSQWWAGFRAAPRPLEGESCLTELPHPPDQRRIGKQRVTVSSAHFRAGEKQTQATGILRQKSSLSPSGRNDPSMLEVESSPGSDDPTPAVLSEPRV